MSMAKSSEFTIETLSASHVKSAVQLFVKSFCDSEPITNHLGIQYDDYEPFAKEVVLKAVNDGLSKVAVDKTNHVIACCIAEDMSDPFIPKLSHYPKLKPVFDVLEKLSEPFLSGKKFLPGKVAHVWIAIVDSKHRGQSLSTAIDMATAEILARKGYDFVYAEFTNPISERIVNQYSLYQLCNKVSYDEFTNARGNKPFQGVPGNAASYIIVIRPGIKLDFLEQCYKVEERY